MIYSDQGTKHHKLCALRRVPLEVQLFTKILFFSINVKISDQHVIHPIITVIKQHWFTHTIIQLNCIIIKSLSCPYKITTTDNKITIRFGRYCHFNNSSLNIYRTIILIHHHCCNQSLCQYLNLICFLIKSCSY